VIRVSSFVFANEWYHYYVDFSHLFMCNYPPGFYLNVNGIEPANGRRNDFNMKKYWFVNHTQLHSWVMGIFEQNLWSTNMTACRKE